MKKYWEIIKISFKAQIAWRFDVAMTMVFTITKILFAYILWGAVYNQRETVAGFTFQTMLAYYVVNAFLSQIEMSDGVSGEVSGRIRGGTFSKYMVIPANVQGYFMAQSAGVTAFYLLFSLLAAVLWQVLFRIPYIYTRDGGVILSAVVLVLMGLFFMVQLNYFLGILTFKFQDIGLFLMIKSHFTAFVTGTLIPLVLLPENVQLVMRAFPFYYVSYLPSMLLIGEKGEEALTGLAVLGGWIIFFSAVNRLMYKRLRVRYDGVGI